MEKNEEILLSDEAMATSQQAIEIPLHSLAVRAMRFQIIPCGGEEIFILHIGEDVVYDVLL